MPQIQQNDKGFHYILQFKRQGDPDSLLVTNPIDDWTRYNFTYATSDVYRPYEITLKAKNSIGEALQDAVTIIGYSGEESEFSSLPHVILIPPGTDQTEPLLLMIYDEL